MKVFFDSTSWCGGLLTPHGSNSKLLALAATGGPLRGLTSDVVLLEVFRNAVSGSLGRRFDPDDVRDYFSAHQPLLETNQSPIGRALPDRADLHNLPVGQIVYQLTGETRSDMLEDLGQQVTLTTFDEFDVHVVAAAAAGGADVICSSDNTFFKGSFGGITARRPGDLASEFGL